MPRPALIIGVGGTGESVLSWLKKSLIETHGNLADIPVRLLLLDVVEPVANVGGLQVRSADSGQTSSGKEDPTDMYNARISLSEFASVGAEEFLRLPDNGTGQAERNIVDAVRSDEAVRNGQRQGGNISLPHFDWLRVNHFGAAVPNLYDGAGRFRQLGRLALLQGLNHGGNDKVYSRIRALIDQIASLSPTRSLDVHIVGSFAGGTGSGLFLDVAWLVRKAAEDKTGDPSGVFVTGFFAMPDVFSATPNRQLRYKAFCAWRELNRMQTVHPEELHNGFRVMWGTDESVIYDVKQPAYDHVYLVDANREGAPFDGKLLFPIMAEGLNFFLDSDSGTEYIQRITRNLGPRKQGAGYRGRPTFSAFFVKAWKLPTQHRALMYQHKVAARYLELLLGIEQTSFVDQATNTQGARYVLTEQALCGQRGGEILNGNLPKTGNTTFIEFLGRLHRGALEPYKKEGEINQAAQLDAPLLTTFVQLPGDEDGQRAAALIAEATGFTVPEYSVEFKARENLEQIYKMLHGVDGRSGKVEEIYGDFSTEVVPGRLYEGLDVAHRHHMDVFKRRIVEWTRTELQTSEAGKLACVIRAVETLRDYLDDGLDFLRETVKRQSDVQKSADQARAAYNESLDATENPGLLAKIMRRPTRTVTDWLAAERDNVDARRNRRAAQRLINTLTTMRQYVQDVVLTQLYRVKNTLVGDNTTNTTMGLYRAVLARIDQENRRYQADLAISGAVELLADNEPIPDPNNADVAPLVAQSRWTVNDDMGLSITVQITDQLPIELRPDNSNLDLLAERLIYQISAAVSSDVVGRVPALQKLGLDRLMRELTDCQATLFRGSNLTLRETRTFYISLQGTDADSKRKIDEAIARLGIGGGDSAGATLQAENPNKIVVFSARELLLPEQFGEWDECYKEYNTQIIGDPGRKIPADLESVRCDHLFMAEQRAVELEARVRSAVQKNPDIFGKDEKGTYRYNGQQLPVLNARLVHLLASQDRLRDMIKIWILGWMAEDQGFWTLNLPGQRPVQLSSAVSADMLTMFSAFVSDETWVAAAFDYQTVQARLAQAWKQELSVNLSSIQARCKFEQEMCGLIRLLHTELMLLTPGLAGVQRAQAEAYLPLRQPLAPDILEATLQGIYDDLHWDANAIADYRDRDQHGHAALAHQFCKDFIMMSGQDQPLINNLTAHEQAVEFVLYFLFGDLLTELKGTARPTR